MENRGQVGLDVAKGVMLTLLAIAVIGFAIIIALATMSDTNVAQTSGSGSASQETHNVTHTALIFNDEVDCLATVTNATLANQSTLSILSGNYTTASTENGCTIILATTNVPAYLNGTNWNLTYTYTYNEFGEVSRNVTTGASDFFNNTGTWFALLAVVVIILIIAIVILAVNRFGGRNTGL